MSPPNLPAAADSGNRHPQPGLAPDEPLHVDPDIAAQLEFEPVPRQINRPDGWTAERQREFIQRLAISGSPQKACVEMGKNVTGIEALYKVASADSFRAAWDLAVKIGRQAQGIDGGPPHLGPVPGIARRKSPGGRASMAIPDCDDDEPEMSEAIQLQLIEGLLAKWLAKVEEERRARLAGEVVAADFYLRQVTFFEITYDLMCSDLGRDAWAILSNLRRGGTHITQIAETPLSRILDQKRREMWQAMGDPDRPEHPPARYLISKLDYSLEPLEYEQGGPEGQALKSEYERRHEEDAKKQAEWESTQRRAQEAKLEAQRSRGWRAVDEQP